MRRLKTVFDIHCDIVDSEQLRRINMMNDPMIMSASAVRAAKPVAERARENGIRALKPVFREHAEKAFDDMTKAYTKATKQ